MLRGSVTPLRTHGPWSGGQTPINFRYRGDHASLRVTPGPDRASVPLRAHMRETVTPLGFRVEGESGLERDERIGAGPGSAGNRGGGKGDAATVHGGVQAEDRPGGRRLQGAGRRRGVAAPGGVVLLPSDDVACGAGAGGAGRGAEDARPRAAGGRSPRQETRRASAGDQPVAAARRTG